MNRIPRFTRLVAALGLGLSLATTLLASRPAQAEGEIRIAEQFGIVYLLLNVVRDQRLIEKHGQAEGLQIKVDWTQLSGGAAVNDALLSGAIDIAGAGVGPLLTIWDRTRGRQNVKAVASLGNFPYYLLSNDPRVRSIADFGAGDRIAVPAVGVSVQSRFLQYAAAKQWGDKQFDRLDKYTVALPHPDATAALVAGGTELTGHFSNPPFQDQALANPKVHVVLDSYELLGPNSPTVLFATEKFRQDNPKTYRAFVEALKEAAAFAQNDKAAAADTYIRVTGAKIDRAALLKIIANPQVDGWDVLDTIRKTSRVRIIMLTGRGRLHDKLKGLDGGADDYLVKPFEFPELLARIRSLQRRGDKVVDHPTLRVADLELDPGRHRAFRGDLRVELTTKEFALLRLLMSHPGEALTRSQIISLVWDMNFDCDTNVIDVAIRRLRAKIDDPFENKLIHTLRGVGYVIEERS